MVLLPTVVVGRVIMYCTLAMQSAHLQLQYLLVLFFRALGGIAPFSTVLNKFSWIPLSFISTFSTRHPTWSWNVRSIHNNWLSAWVMSSSSWPFISQVWSWFLVHPWNLRKVTVQKWLKGRVTMRRFQWCVTLSVSVTCVNAYFPELVYSLLETYLILMRRIKRSLCAIPTASKPELFFMLISLAWNCLQRP